MGGAGGPGGKATGSAKLHDACAGGAGGNGGNGGQGGGGQGGHALALAVEGSVVPATGWTATAGNAGTGGAGDDTNGNMGDGAAGVATGCFDFDTGMACS